MRVLCASDYHGNHHFIDSTIDAIQKHDVDVFLYCGDFVFQSYAEELLSRVENEAGVHALAVCGNLDMGFVYEGEKAEIVIYGLRRIGRYRFLLVSATYPFSLDEALSDVKGIDGSRLVFVTHYPPKGILDRIWSNEHVGYEGYLEFDQRAKPVLHAFGHIHEDNGHIVKDGTIFFNCAATPSRRIYLVELEKGEVREVRL